MGKARTLKELDVEWQSFTARLPSSDALEAQIKAFNDVLAQFPLPNGEGHLRPQHMLPAFFDAVKGERDNFSYTDFLESLADKGFPALDKTTLKPFEISFKKQQSLTLSQENLAALQESMEPFVRSYAADLLIQQERQAIRNPNKGANQYLNRLWGRFKGDIANDSTLNPHAEALEKITSEHNLRPQDAFNLTVEVLNSASKEVRGTAEKFNYTFLLEHAAKGGYLPKIGKDEIQRKFPEGAKIKNQKGEEVTIPAEKLHEIYATATALAPAYGQAHVMLLRTIPARDAALAEERAAPTKQEEKEVTVDEKSGDAQTQGTGKASQQGDGSNARGDEGTEPSAKDADGKSAEEKSGKNTENKVTKFLFSTTKGKITVAAAAVAAVSMVLAMMLGRKSNQQQNVVAGAGRH